MKKFMDDFVEFTLLRLSSTAIVKWYTGTNADPEIDEKKNNIDNSCWWKLTTCAFVEIEFTIFWISHGFFMAKTKDKPFTFHSGNCVLEYYTVLPFNFRIDFFIKKLIKIAYSNDHIHWIGRRTVPMELMDGAKLSKNEANELTGWHPMKWQKKKNVRYKKRFFNKNGQWSKHGVLNHSNTFIAEHIFYKSFLCVSFGVN